MNKQSDSLLQQLAAYSTGGYYPFHMPGHKRAKLDFPNPWSIDITEIEGFDNLHHAEGILRELQEEAACLFGADKSFCLINGSTCGLLSAVSACVKPGGKLLMSRNCHKSVYHGVYLRNITPIYMMPEMTDFGIMGSLSPDTVAHALKEHPDTEAVLVVSPTYDGVVSDIRAIAKIAHSHGIPLIVDEAHGAHFPLSDDFPASAVSCGADVVIESLHKTLPAFTQTALLHLSSNLVTESDIRRFLGIYQSSSPSYLLMASVSQCIALLKKDGAQLFSALRRNLNDFYKACESLHNIHVFTREESRKSGCFDWDNSKILISATRLGLSGQELHDILLTRYHIQLEMAAGHYGLALASLMDREEGFQRLFDALAQLDAAEGRQLLLHDDAKDSPHPGHISKTAGMPLHKYRKHDDIINSAELYQLPQQAMNIAHAMDKPGRTVLLADSVGAVSQEYIYLYPPGIPLIAPGEEISETLISNISRIKAAGLNLEGLSDMTNTRINIVNS